MGVVVGLDCIILCHACSSRISSRIMLRDKVDKKVRLRWDRKRRSYVSVVREHYFRDDISCKSELCQQPSCLQQLGASGEWSP